MEWRKAGVPLSGRHHHESGQAEHPRFPGRVEDRLVRLDDDRSESVHPPEVVHPVHGHHCTTGRRGVRRRSSGEGVDLVAVAAQRVHDLLAVHRVAGLEGQQHLDLADADLARRPDGARRPAR